MRTFDHEGVSMYEFLWLLAGAIGYAIVSAFLRRRRHRILSQRDDEKYKNAWQTAIELMVQGGQITDKQLEQITPNPLHKKCSTQSL